MLLSTVTEDSNDNARDGDGSVLNNSGPRFPGAANLALLSSRNISTLPSFPSHAALTFLSLAILSLFVPPVRVNSFLHFVVRLEFSHSRMSVLIFGNSVTECQLGFHEHAFLGGSDPFCDSFIALSAFVRRHF